MSPHFGIMRVGFAAVLAIAGLVASPPSQVGAVPTDRWVATTGSDTSNDCSNSGSPCLTINHAIGEASYGDYIVIGAGTFVENLIVDKELTFSGNGMDNTFVDGGGTGRVFDVLPGNSVNIFALTIQNGGGGVNGAGISNGGILLLDDVAVTNNHGEQGGGIRSSGPLTILDSEISWNTATDAGIGLGGGLYTDWTGTTSLTNVTLAYNTAEVYSGGIQFSAAGILNLTNVTLKGNRANTAAAMTVTANGTANIVNSTIAENSNNDLAFGRAITGYSTLTFKNTIVSGNSPENCLVGGGSTWTSLGYNLDTGTTCGFGSTGDLSSTDPELAQMGDYGGMVPTMPLLGTSPAIDSGTNTGCPGTDARGFTRPMNGPGAGGNVCDRGAVEMKPETTVIGPYGLTPSPSVFAQNVDAEVTVSGSSTTPSGTVEITAGDITCPATLSFGYGNCGFNFDDPGPMGVLFRYTGDATHDASQAAVLHIVKQAPRTDFDGDHTTDPAKFEPGTGIVSWRDSSTLLWDSADLGMDVSSYVPRSDFGGDGKADPAKFVASANAVWFLDSSTALWDGVYMGPGAFTLVGGSDFDGDGKTDPARFDSSTNALWYLKSTTSTWDGIYMGPGTYQVLAGADYDGDGAADPALFYSTGGANALWYRASGTGTWQGVYMGPGTYEMVEASDFDGDGMTDPTLFISGANAVWYLESSSSSWQSFYMGPGTLEPVAASDFDGDGKTDPAEFIPATSELWWFKSSTSTWDGLWMGGGTYDVVN